jgi:hypothetical protein
MKQYIFIIILIITIFVFYISLIPIKESMEDSTIPDNYGIKMDTSKSLRDLFAKLYYISMLDSNTQMDNGDNPTVCYKINKLSFYFDAINAFFDDKTEEEIMNVYGYIPAKQLAGQDVGEKPPVPIISSNGDYVNLIKLFTYSKMLKPYNDLKIWSKSDNLVTSHCKYTDSESNALVKCADNMLKDISELLKYFQNQVDTSGITYDGDSRSTGTGTGTLVNNNPATPVSSQSPNSNIPNIPNINTNFFKMPKMPM